MPKTKMSADDRLDIYDLFARYAWAYDTGDAKGMAALFLPDGVMEGMDGSRHEGRDKIAAFCSTFIDGPEFAGTQHHNSQLRIEGDGQRCTVRCYWLALRWHPENDSRYIKSMGYYISHCVKIGDDWRFRERIIRYWKGANAPWLVPLAPF